MPDRFLREKGIASSQRLAALETSTRSLRQRARVGAVRTSDAVGTVILGTPTSYNILTNITVPSGRWQVFAQCSVGLLVPTVINEQFIMSAFAYDTETSEILDDGQFDNPSGYAWFPPVDAVPALHSMSTLCDLYAPETTTIYLAAANLGGSDSYVVEPRLRLHPA